MSSCKCLKNVTVDAKVTAEFPELFKYSWARSRPLTPEIKAEMLEDAVKEFHEFIRDHRSQDPVRLDVERVTQDICSVCENEWETVEEEGVVYCAHCGATVEQVPSNANPSLQGAGHLVDRTLQGVVGSLNQEEK